VTKTQSAGPISCLEHRATRVLHCVIVPRAAVLMFPLLLQTVLSGTHAASMHKASSTSLYLSDVAPLIVVERGGDAVLTKHLESLLRTGRRQNTHTVCHSNLAARYANLRHSQLIPNSTHRNSLRFRFRLGLAIRLRL